MELERMPEDQGRRRRPVQRAAGAAGPGGAQGALLAVQGSAGNAAARAMVQRAVQIDEVEVDAEPQRGGPARDVDASATPELGMERDFDAGTPAAAGSSAAGATPASATAASAPADAAPGGGVNELGPVAHVGTLIADSIVAASYSPGAGNIW